MGWLLRLEKLGLLDVENFLETAMLLGKGFIAVHEEVALEMKGSVVSLLQRGAAKRFMEPVDDQLGKISIDKI